MAFVSQPFPDDPAGFIRTIQALSTITFRKEMLKVYGTSTPTRWNLPAAQDQSVLDRLGWLLGGPNDLIAFNNIQLPWSEEDAAAFVAVARHQWTAEGSLLTVAYLARLIGEGVFVNVWFGMSGWDWSLEGTRTANKPPLRWFYAPFGQPETEGAILTQPFSRGRPGWRSSFPATPRGSGSSAESHSTAGAAGAGV